MANTTQTPRPAAPLAPARRGAIQRWTRTLIPTSREAPADAELPSHVLLSRAGYIRRLGAGIYDYLPLAKRVLTKIETIVREEMDAAGASEMLLPALEPMELFKGTKRDLDYGDLLFCLEDRHGRRTALGPTHEEVVTELMAASVTSYKQLPINLYQIQTKFRDEFRPRAGLLRGREFIMKDAYSFHLAVGDEPGLSATEADAGLNTTYDAMHRAYTNIFARCGLGFTVVEAESGPIGGSASHEFMVDCDGGEDTILVCPETGYAANVEKCEIGPRPWSLDTPPERHLETKHTPGMPGIDAVAEHLGVTPAAMLKTILFAPADESAPYRWVLAVVRGDHDVNEAKARDAAGFPLALAEADAAKAAGFAIGYVSPRMALKAEGCLVLVDPDATATPAWATGADTPDHHDVGFNWSRDLAELTTAAAEAGPDNPAAPRSVKLAVADIRNAAAGDPSPKAEGATLEARRGIEVGHIFKLGTKYSEAMGFQIMDKDQKRRPVIMGCYGIGVSRTLAACVEQRHDDAGIVWPAPIAPYHVEIVLIKPDDQPSLTAADTLAQQLSERGADVLIDDRPERPGVKFNDADLIGLPVRVTIGPKTLADNAAELKARTDPGKGEPVPLAELADRCLALLTA